MHIDARMHLSSCRRPFERMRGKLNKTIIRRQAKEGFRKNIQDSQGTKAFSSTESPKLHVSELPLVAFQAHQGQFKLAN